MQFFKMANQIFDYRLSPNGFKVFCLLTSRKNILNAAILSYQVIAERCGIDSKTARRAVEELITKELVVKEHRYNIRGYAKNKYTVKSLSGKWFKIEYRLFREKMPSSDFMVLCYIKNRMFEGLQEAYPSLSAIAKDTGISRSRVALAIRFLREHTYLNRVKRHYKKTKALRQNRYLFFRIHSKKKKETRSAKRASFKKLIIKKSYYLFHIIERSAKNVKLFFYSRGSPEIPQQCLDPQRYTIKKE